MLSREYSFVSIGTEKNGSKGYMNVSSVINKYRIISPETHEKSEICLKNADNLYVSSNLEIELICMMRFQLISALSLRDVKGKRVCIMGMGAVGVGAYMECIRQKAKTVTIVSSRKEAVFHYTGIIDIKKSWDSRDYDVYIECTGTNAKCLCILAKCLPGSMIFLLGTPRNSPNVNLLDIHRKNLTLIGGHELNGITNQRRQLFFSQLEKYYIKNYNKMKKMAKYFVKIHEYNSETLNEILEHSYVEPYNIMNHM